MGKLPRYAIYVEIESNLFYIHASIIYILLQHMVFQGNIGGAI